MNLIKTIRRRFIICDNEEACMARVTTGRSKKTRSRMYRRVSSATVRLSLDEVLPEADQPGQFEQRCRAAVDACKRCCRLLDCRQHGHSAAEPSTNLILLEI